MARNSELIRQWEILRAIDAARQGIAVAKLAALRQVHPRTVRRDLGPASRCTKTKSTARRSGKSAAKPFKGLEETGLGVTELCALYFSRSILRRYSAHRPRRSGARVHEAREGAAPGEPQISQPLPRHAEGEVQRPQEAERQEDVRDPRPGARRIPPPAPGRDALLIVVITAHQGLHGRPAPLVLRRRRHLPHRMGGGVRYRCARSRSSESVRSRCSTNTSKHGRCRPSRSQTRSGCTRARRKLWKSSSTRAWRTTCRNANGTSHNRSRSGRTGHCSCALSCATTGRCAAGFTASDRSRGCTRRPASPRRSSKRSSGMRPMPRLTFDVPRMEVAGQPKLPLNIRKWRIA